MLAAPPAKIEVTSSPTKVPEMRSKVRIHDKDKIEMFG